MRRHHRAVPRAVLVLSSAALAVTATACGRDSAPADPGTLAVLASFYPLQFAAERVGGDRVAVTNLTPPGAEPHDLELAPRDVAVVTEADLVVYLSGFQPAVDDAVGQAASGQAWDAADHTDLDLTAADSGHDEEGHEEEGDEPVDPHFWLDPTRLADVADALAEELASLDPEGAATFAANAAALRADLEALDTTFSAGLATCDSRALVTSHTAFGYLAQRYDLEQVGIAGLSPDVEPTAAELADVSAFVSDNDVTTIFYETLVSPDVAETVARETGAATAVLDPLEGLVPDGATSDYLTVMDDNLASLSDGLGCR